MGGKVGINQAFGNYNPGIERYSKDGRNYGVDFGVKEGTPLALPPGEWKVVQAFAGAKGKGRIGDSTNSGYGNSVLVLNTKTGEMMRFSHLQSVNLSEGSVYKGGTIFGRSGATGNVTGPHLDLEYKDSGGQLRDIMSSQYAKYLFEN
jgi:murein DD-endopeptidase MepM/ murein hydrolase activator NlpD